ncbi:hypothetical protein [Helicobacter sp. MIT 14-3879]|uniref:hypothetical protein n=1 Tax=Helicobacter sp. MIT 14-3879 TaxID=2040649 RepID=UPI000E1F681E|nr:hypothetical protein [Helicobacter sp. MIT 14-3879]RDU60231.1 hypothetical protein CQA44_10715 [Helicobacter sp. MIT 14-3879]
MKKILFILLCIFCINTSAYDSFGISVRNLKHYGFGFCLQQSYVDKKDKSTALSYDLYVFQKGSMKFAAMGEPKNEEQVAKIIQSYVSQFMSNPQGKVTTKLNLRIFVQDCMQLYESKEYQDEIERIVKKYCKDCK